MMDTEKLRNIARAIDRSSYMGNRPGWALEIKKAAAIIDAQDKELEQYRARATVDFTDVREKFERYANFCGGHQD